MNNAVFGKAMENVRKYRNIQLVATKSRRNYLVSGPNCHTTKFFFKKFISHRNEKNTSIHELTSLLRSINNKPAMFKFWHDYVKPKHREKANCVTWIQIAL